MAKKIGSLGAAALALGLSSSVARAAEPTEKAVCIDASEQGQELRDDGKYELARKAFMRCAEVTCPDLVKRDCVQWLVDLDQRSPTVVLSARSEKGDDLVDVQVTLDQAPIATKLDGEPIRVDPGAHRLRYEAVGFVTVEEQVVIHAGEKNRIVEAELRSVVPKPTAPTGPPPTAPTAPTASPRAQHPTAPGPAEPPLATWVFGGVALAGFASEAFFGISGMSERSSDLGPGGCAPRCAPAEVNAIQTKLAIADVSLGAAAVSAGLAVYFFLRPRAQTPPVFVGIIPSSSGAAGGVGARF